MQKDRSYWPEWARFLQQWGLDDIVAAMLEAAGPVNLLLAQVVYAGQPILRKMVPGESLDALTILIEDQGESRSFAAFLREESSG